MQDIEHTRPDPTPRRRALSLADLQHTVDLYLSGYSIRQVAALLDLSYTAVRHRLVVLAKVRLRTRAGQ